MTLYDKIWYNYTDTIIRGSEGENNVRCITCYKKIQEDYCEQ